MKYIKNRKALLVVIIIVAALLRFWGLGQVPAGFHADEVAYGYNAYSLLHTGTDEHGESFPFVLKSFGEYKPALYSYLSIPWIIAFDLTPLAIRISSALFGLFSVILLYFLVNRLFKNQKIALLSSFLLAISPWHLNLSRTTSEMVVSVFFLLLLVYALTFLKEKFTLLWTSVAVISGFLAIETYTASRFFVIMLSILFALFSLRFVHKKLVFNLKLFLISAVFIGMGIFVSVLDGASRFNQVSIFSNPQTQLTLEEQIREDQSVSPLLTRSTHNKIVNYVRTTFTHYDEYFSLDFLFLQGGKPDRMIIPDSGLFYLWQLPFLLIGIYVLLRKKLAFGFFLLAWWLILLLPAAITFDEIPNVYRSLIVLPPMIIIIATGIYELFSYRSFNKTVKLALFASIAFIGIWEFAYFQHQYFRHQEVHQPWSRGYANKPLVDSLKELTPNYQKIAITRSYGNPYIYVLFYEKYDPKSFQTEKTFTNGYVSGFNKYEFLDVDCPLHIGKDGKDIIQPEAGVLYVSRGDCEDDMQIKNSKLIKTIYWQDGNPAFKLLEYTPPQKSESMM